MLLGKRPRPSMRRTTSMTEFSLDLPHIEPPPPQTPTTIRPLPAGAAPEEQQHHNLSRRNTVSGGDTNNTLLSMASTTTHRRNSHGFLETPHFLRTCELCKRSLRPGRDIFMYRGDTAFCSSECRQQQMNHDERKEKCSMASKKEIQPSTIMMTPGSEASTNGETIAAA